MFSKRKKEKHPISAQLLPNHSSVSSQGILTPHADLWKVSAVAHLPRIHSSPVSMDITIATVNTTHSQTGRTYTHVYMITTIIKTPLGNTPPLLLLLRSRSPFVCVSRPTTLSPLCSFLRLSIIINVKAYIKLPTFLTIDMAPLPTPPINAGIFEFFK